MSGAYFISGVFFVSEAVGFTRDFFFFSFFISPLRIFSILSRTFDIIIGGGVLFFCRRRKGLAFLLFLIKLFLGGLLGRMLGSLCGTFKL